MGDLVQFRRDTIDNWQSVNPILADGEFIIVRTSDNTQTIGYKTGNGVNRFNDLEYNSNASYVEEFGEGHTVSLSQYYTSQITTEYNVSYFHFNDADASRYFTLAEAIQLVPQAIRKVGLKVTFLSSDSKNWETWQCINTTGFTNVNNWKNTEEVSDVIQPPANLESGDYLYNIYYHPTTGVKTYEPSRLTTNFIQVDEGQILTYKIYGYTSSIAIAAFDAKKNILLDKCIITSSLTGEEGQYVVDDSVKFLRITRLNNTTGLNQTASFYKADYQPIIEESFGGIRRLSFEDFTVKGVYINNTTGKESVNASWNATPFIPVVEGEFIYHSLYGSTGGAVVAFYDKTKKLIESIPGNATYESRIVEVPENSCYVRFSSSSSRPFILQIISGTNRNQYLSEAKGEFIIKGFSDFIVEGTWSRNGEDLTVTGGGFTQARLGIETFEDSFVMSCRVKATVATNGAFEMGIGKMSSAPGYVDRWITMCKDSTGSYLKSYYRPNGSYAEQVDVRQTLSTELLVDKWYVLQLVKTTSERSFLTAYLYDEQGNLLAFFRTSTAAYAWGYPTVTNRVGQARFSGFTMSYPKKDYPLVAVYGDSFIEGDTIRNTKNLRYSSLLQEVLGKENCLLFGHGGASTKSDNSRTLLQLQKVNSAYAILAYGNNDADWSTWWKYMEYMLRLCKLTDTIPIFVTVTPRVGQSDAYIAKITAINDWIKSSGYSYIDANKACTTNGLTWKSGYVMDDGVHPTILGHQAIFDQIKVDCPFLLKNGLTITSTKKVETFTEQAIQQYMEFPKGKNYINFDDLLYGWAINNGQWVEDVNGVCSNRLFLEDGETYTMSNIAVFSSTLKNMYMAYFDKNGNYLKRTSHALTVDATGTKGKVTFVAQTAGAFYVRILLKSGNVTSVFVPNGQLEKGNVATAFEPYAGTNYKLVTGVTSQNKNTLLTGASFAFSDNEWFSYVCESLGITGYNKAVSGETMQHTAQKMHDGTLYSQAEFEDFDVLLIFHSHNQVVTNPTYLKENYEDYVFPLTDRSAQWDYVLKKYAAECYAARLNANSKWYGTKYGKPYQVVVCTHWHDARTIFNDSIRELQAKWGFTLCELDKRIGFSKNKVHPVTGEQVSILHCDNPSNNTEIIDGVEYGWHPTRNKGAWIQHRMAEIVKESLR